VSRPLIIGGGLAGGAAAAALAAAGARPLLLERQAEAHDKICGEFLSVEAGHTLARLGLDVARLGGAPIDRVALWHGRRQVMARLPFVATGISRRVLDAALLAHAAGLGAEIRHGEAWKLAEARPATSGITLLATGKHDLPGSPRDRTGTLADMIGFKMFFHAPALARQLAGTVAVVFFEGGYAGLQPVEGGRLNLCLLVEQAHYKPLGDWPALLARLLAEPGLAALADAEALLARPLTISRVPYGYIAPPPADGLWRLGDQAAVIPSFCGDGMAIAVHSGALAGRLWGQGASAAQFQARLAADVRGQVRLATGLQRLSRRPWARLAMLMGLAAVPGAVGLLARATRVQAVA
jgi:flavin-dependent dehydrogenase